MSFIDIGGKLYNPSNLISVECRIDENRQAWALVERIDGTSEDCKIEPSDIERITKALRDAG